MLSVVWDSVRDNVVTSKAYDSQFVEHKRIVVALPAIRTKY